MEKKGGSAVLPKDPFILLSYVDTKLRDEYDTLDELCAALGEEREALEARLREAGFVYDETRNRFV